MNQATTVFRTEKKYQVAPVVAKCIEHKLRAILPLDPFCSDGKPYPVRSLYFDSLDNHDYFEKEAGLENRKKIRLRNYGPGTNIKMEVKQKQGNAQTKTSIPVSPGQAAELIKGNYESLWQQGTPFAQSLYTQMKERAYIPRCMVEYQRLAFVLPTNDIRITLDSRISSNEGNFNILSDRVFLYPVARSTVILEVKYNHFLLEYIREALASFEITETASSKYCAARYYGLGGTLL